MPKRYDVRVPRKGRCMPEMVTLSQGSFRKSGRLRPHLGRIQILPTSANWDQIRPNLADPDRHRTTFANSGQFWANFVQARRLFGPAFDDFRANCYPKIWGPRRCKENWSGRVVAEHSVCYPHVDEQLLAKPQADLGQIWSRFGRFAPHRPECGPHRGKRSATSGSSEGSQGEVTLRDALRATSW